MQEPESAVSPTIRNKQVLRVIWLEGFANFLVLILKITTGIWTGSLAIIGDALHSLTDIANNVVAWAIIKHANKPADKEHPYGHHKFETLAVIGLAIFLVVLAIELTMHALQRETTKIDSSPWALGVMIGVLLINIAVATWEHNWAKKLNSDILHADASHTFADVLTTIAVIIGWQLSAMGYAWLDQVAAIIVSMMILHLAYQLFKKAAPILVDEYSIDPELVAQQVILLDGVEKVKRVRSRWIGSQASVDMVVCVKPHVSTQAAHEICDRVETLLEKEFDVKDVSIHVEPYLPHKS